MYWDVTDVKVIDNHALHVRFKDGVEGDVIFDESFFRGVFAHLIDPARFRDVGVVGGAVTWPGDLDLAPDAMHRSVLKHGAWVVSRDAH